eukprot:1056366-Rhodomonas_salina.1
MLAYLQRGLHHQEAVPQAGRGSVDGVVLSQVCKRPWVQGLLLQSRLRNKPGEHQLVGWAGVPARVDTASGSMRAVICFRVASCPTLTDMVPPPVRGLERHRLPCRCIWVPLQPSVAPTRLRSPQARSLEAREQMAEERWATLRQRSTFPSP